MFETATAHEPWLGIVLAAVGLHLLVALYAYRRAGSRDVATDPTAESADDVVTCPECGADNERGYRFCRHCVGDLPGADGRVATSGPSRSGSRF